jgi:hypothetical protein
VKLTPDEFLRASVAWTHLEDDPAELAFEIEQVERTIAIYEGDLAAADTEICGDDLEICRNAIAYEQEVLKRLIKQGERLARATLPTSIAPPLDLARMRERMERAKTLDPQDVLERVTGSWPRLAPGDKLNMLCPLPDHEEKTPSFYMWPDGHWKCFGCGRGGGDVVSFAAAYLASSQMSGLALLERIFEL